MVVESLGSQDLPSRFHAQENVWIAKRELGDDESLTRSVSFFVGFFQLFYFRYLITIIILKGSNIF